MTTQALPAGSGFSDVDQTSDPAAYVQRLDSVGAIAFWQRLKQRTYDLLDVRPGDHLLEVGCGTGDDARLLAQRVGRTGRVVAVDRSAVMLAEARRRAEGLGLPLAFQQGDAHRLAFLDRSFDRCRVERVLQHLDDPAQALAELVRVARPGARIVLVEPDYGLQVMQGADLATTRKILEVRCRHFRSGRIGSALPKLCKEAGLANARVSIAHLVTPEFALNRARLETWMERANAAGAVTAAEGAAWLGELAEAARAGRYRHAVPVFLVSADKP